MLKRFHDDGQPAEDIPLLHWNCQQALYQIQQRLDEILAHYPSRPLGWLLRRIVFPWGRHFRQPSDQLGHDCARLLLKPSTARDRLTASMFISRDPKEATGMLEYALEKVLAAKPIEQRLAQAGFQGTPQEALARALITKAEASLLEDAARATQEVIAVDDFDPEELAKGQIVPGSGLHAVAS